MFHFPWCLVELGVGVGRENTSSTHHSFGSLRRRWSSCPLRVVEWHRGDEGPMGTQDGAGKLAKWQVCCWTLTSSVFLSVQEEKVWLCKSYPSTTHTHTELPCCGQGNKSVPLAVLIQSSCVVKACQFETRPQLWYQLFPPQSEYQGSTACQGIL